MKLLCVTIGEFLGNLLGGLLSGLIATIYLYLLKTRWTIPDFIISDVIAENKGKYTIKIQNASKRTFSNIQVRITYRTKANGSPTFPNDKVPILHGMNEDGMDKTYYGMYESEIEIEEVRKRKTTSYVGNVSKKNELEQEEQTQKESVADFFKNNNEDGIVEAAFSFDDHHKIFGDVKRFVTKKYTNSDVIKTSSRFLEGTVNTIKIDSPHYEQ